MVSFGKAERPCRASAGRVLFRLPVGQPSMAALPAGHAGALPSMARWRDTPAGTGLDRLTEMPSGLPLRSASGNVAGRPTTRGSALSSERPSGSWRSGVESKRGNGDILLFRFVIADISGAEKQRGNGDILLFRFAIADVSGAEKQNVPISHSAA